MKRTLPALILVAALLAGCSSSLPAPGDAVADVPDYAMTGAEPRAITPEPYARTPETVLPLEDPDRPVDGAGVLQVTWPDQAGPIYHPVSLAHYALYMLESYRTTGTREYLDRAVANAEALLDGAEERAGALWFPYGFDYQLHDDEAQTLTAPWYSGMAQGQALSLFVRLHAETDDDRWTDAADATARTFDARPGEGGPWFAHVVDGHLWFEEYVDDAVAPTQVVNGHIYAAFGLYDYATRTGDPDAAQLFDGAATTVAETFDTYRLPGGLSYYCAAQYCIDTDWRPPNYHRGVTKQFESLALMTGRGVFLEQAASFRADYAASGASA
ncbi:D-glucuronyl C5-epimerase family protein [Georgenia sp. TF02-10]|uniref:D-glucuronyl C5-epimerase family protein n=1 Tax=Georgenia sp. TF02-10 TaxID=2917725 RepID=UPI001FA75D10|nr:D-glucuronyl C5-epimerase family protein [Georgenia sp. TF02-10]UNX56229.1 D-glucuronyl C5-epimerase family protein [Georgenia sp. TF02-10]